MTKIERKIMNGIIEQRHILFFAIVSLFGIIVRVFGFNIVSGDMYGCLQPWFEKIKAGGFSSLSSQIGDYNLLYQTIVAFMTKIDIPSIYQYKILSVCGDYFLALSSALFTVTMLKKKVFDSTFNIVYGVVLMLPTVVLNSAYWGQCDSLYTAFVVLALYFAYNSKWNRSFLMLGIAFAFKLQAVFILPFIIFLYFDKREFSILKFLISVAAFWSSGIVSFFYGRSLLAPFEIYLYQTGEYKQMYMNFASVWVLLGNNYSYSKVAIFVTLVLLGLMLYLILSGKVKINSKNSYVSLAAWSVWTCILFLPAMHDRYAYMLDVLLIIAAFLDKRNIKFAILSFLMSLIVYGKYLVGSAGVTAPLVLLYVGGYAYFSYLVISDGRGKTKATGDIQNG